MLNEVFEIYSESNKFYSDNGLLFFLSLPILAYFHRNGYFLSAATRGVTSFVRLLLDISLFKSDSWKNWRRRRVFQRINNYEGVFRIKNDIRELFTSTSMMLFVCLLIFVFGNLLALFPHHDIPVAELYLLSCFSLVLGLLHLGNIIDFDRFEMRVAAKIEAYKGRYREPDLDLDEAIARFEFFCASRKKFRPIPWVGPARLDEPIMRDRTPVP